MNLHVKNYLIFKKKGDLRIFMGKIIKDGIQYAGSASTAKRIKYDNKASGLSANSVQNAIDEIAGNTSGINITLAEYNALSEEEKNHGIYYITDVDDNASASTTMYDNTNSGLGAKNVQNAIDEVNDTFNKIVRRKTITSSSFAYDKVLNLNFGTSEEKVVCAICTSGVVAVVPFIMDNWWYAHLYDVAGASKTSGTYTIDIYYITKNHVKDVI